MDPDGTNHRNRLSLFRNFTAFINNLSFASQYYYSKLRSDLSRQYWCNIPQILLQHWGKICLDSQMRVENIAIKVKEG